MLHRKFIVVALLLFIFHFGNAQTFEQMIDKAESFHMTNMDSSIYFYQLAEKIAIEKNDSSQIATATSLTASMYKLQEKFDLAIKYTNRTLAYTNTKLDKAKALILLAVMYDNEKLVASDSLFQEAEVLANELQDSALFYNLNISRASAAYGKGDYYNSIDLYLETLKFSKGDYIQIQIFLKLANAFLVLENNERALEYINIAKSLAQKNDYQSFNGILSIVHAKILKNLNQFEASNIELEKAIDNLKNKKKWNSLATAYLVQTNLFIENEKWDLAKKSNNLAVGLFAQCRAGNKAGILINDSRMSFYEKKYNNAFTKANEAIQIAKTSAMSMRLKKAYYQAAIALDKLNQPQQAFDHLQKHISLKDSLFSSNQNALITSLESKYDRQKKEAAIAILDAENVAKTTQLSKQKLLLIISGIAILIISGLLFFLLKTFRKIKSQNKIISNSLDEKDTLLREIHHRVKNNLQLVSSLLGLQSQSIEDPKALEAINSGKARVKSMALIHQDLYHRDNLTGISVKDYFQKLCRELIASYQVDVGKINLTTEIEDLNLDVDTLVPLGLIVNELLTNALKYAFPNDGIGNVFVKLFEKEGQLFLEIKDNGIGLDISKKKKSSFGIKLVNTLLYQLDGTMNQEKGSGTHLILSFDNFKKAA